MASHFNSSPLPVSTVSTGSQGPLLIVTVLFFMWGLLTSLNDVLIPHLKAVYSLSYVEAMMVQSCFFAAYFLVSLPAGYAIRRIGYQGGVVLGLVVAAAGCALFYPAAWGGYGVFLSALFILASGITILQVAANPYVTLLGPASSASRRLTLTQAFNSLGTTIAPALGGMLILSSTMLDTDQLARLSAAEQAVYAAEQAASVQLPYLALATTLLVMAGLFAIARLPRIDSNITQAGVKEALPVHLKLGILAVFLYVGAEVSIGSFLINFLGSENVSSLSAVEAAHYASFYWGGALVGRFAGYVAMRRVSPGNALTCSAACAGLLLVAAVIGNGKVAHWAILAVGLFNSIMFPTIFSMALHKLGAATGRGSGLLCMAIVGGAIIPLVQGVVADSVGVQLSFLVPMLCYLFVLFYGVRFKRLK